MIKYAIFAGGYAVMCAYAIVVMADDPPVLLWAGAFVAAVFGATMALIYAREFWKGKQ